MTTLKQCFVVHSVDLTVTRVFVQALMTRFSLAAWAGPGQLYAHEDAGKYMVGLVFANWLAHPLPPCGWQRTSFDKFAL